MIDSPYGPTPPDLTGPSEPQLMQVALPTTPPLVTRTLVGLIVAVFILGLAIDFLLGFGIDLMDVSRALFALGAKINDPILVGGQYYRLVSVMFLHAGILHLAMNTYALWIIGQDVERFYGHLRFALIFFLGGLAGSVASLAFTPGPAVGASGAVFAIFGSEMVLLYTNREIFGDMARERLRSLVLLLVLNAAIGISMAGTIDNFAHLGGFLGGSIVAYLMVPHYRVAAGTGGFGPAHLTEDAPGNRLWFVSAAWLAGMALIVAWLTVRNGS